MKKLYFSMLLMAGLALTACSSDDNSTEQQAPKTYYMTVDATKAMNEATSRLSNRALSLDLETSRLNATWATSEQVFVQGKYYSNGSPFWFKGSIKPQYAGATTRLNGVISLPDEVTTSMVEAIEENMYSLTLQFPRKEVDYDGQKGTLADIAAKYDYAVAKDVRVDVEADKVKGVFEVKFVNQQAIVKFTLRDKTDATKLLNPTALTIQYGDEESPSFLYLTSIPADTYTTNGDGVLYVAIPGFSGKLILTATVGGVEHKFTKNSVTFEDGQYYERNIKM